jgi:hypothetical protein
VDKPDLEMRKLLDSGKVKVVNRWIRKPAPKKKTARRS